MRKSNKKDKEKKVKNSILEKNNKTDNKVNSKRKQQLENEINEILDGLTIEEITELEAMGDFSKEAIEWLRDKKKKKRFSKQQDEFNKRLKVSDEVLKRIELIGKLAGYRNGQYKPKTISEKTEFDEMIEEVDRDERIREKEKEIGDSRGKSGSKVYEKEQR